MARSSTWRGEQFFYREAQLVKTLGHPLFLRIQDSVNEWRQQAPAHSRPCINVRPIGLEKSEGDQDDELMTISLEFFGGYETLLCHPVFDVEGIMTSHVDVQDASTGKWVALKSLLASIFNIEDATEIIYELHDPQKPSFRWGDLPLELKENILQFSVCKPYVHPVRRTNSGVPLSFQGPVEILDQLGEWKSLLWTSRQVRTIILRLTLRGNRWFNGGLCILSFRHMGRWGLKKHDLSYMDVLGRLNRFYQIGEADNSIPTNAATLREAQSYNKFPRCYPHLSQYATFKHGIRRLYLEFDWKQSLHFWRVPHRMFNSRPSYTTCDSFIGLPNLDSIWVTLPRHLVSSRQVTKYLWAPFWDKDVPCLRMLQRLIYEQVARVCAHYSIKVHRIGPFFDDHEENRFWGLNKKAIGNLREQQNSELATLRSKFTSQDLVELYAECGGGIQLPNNGVSAGPTPLEVPIPDVEFTKVDELEFPLQCNCGTYCRVAYDLHHMQHSLEDWIKYRNQPPADFWE